MVFAETGRQLGDETELVRGSKGADGRSKKGDFLATLGDSSGAPGARIAVEVEDQQVRLKAAIDELQEGKANREASVGIFVSARARRAERGWRLPADRRGFLLHSGPCRSGSREAAAFLRFGVPHRPGHGGKTVECLESSVQSRRYPRRRPRPAPSRTAAV